jgi:release factor glutamine methyltransferase
MLAPGGTFLLLLLEQNKPKEVAAVLEAQGLTCKMMATCSADEERLHVMRALKPR